MSLLMLAGATTFGAFAALSPTVAAAAPATWTIMPSPTATLSGISCTSASSCVAVGNVIEQWNGSAWSSTPGPTAGLKGVSCATASFCVAVGNVIEQWNGSAWSVVPSPTGSLSAVSCTSSTFCVAVGNAYPNGLIEQWNGSTWSVGPSAAGVLDGVTCTSSSFCVAVGGNVIEQWNGSTWSAGPSTTGTLDGVSCLSTTSCVAVGFIQTQYLTGTTLVEKWNGSTWSVVPSPSPNYPNYFDNLDELNGVSCTSASACTAVGIYSATAAPARGPYTSGNLIEQWDGTSWTAAPTASTDVSLNGVACPTSSDCIAVGSIIETTAAGATAPPPVVTGVSPNTGSVTGGTPVTITGTGFSGATSVNFGGTNALNFVVVNDSTITVHSPGTTSGGASDITVTSPWGGTSSTSSADQFTYTYPVPLVSSLSPTSGPVAGGTNVVLDGVGFTGATAVTFDGVPGAISYVIDSNVVVTSPPLAPGLHNVQVTTPGGTSQVVTADQFTAVSAPPAPAPAVASISPTSGPTAGGTSVSIKGTGFTGATQVFFGTAPASSFSVSSSTRITALSPVEAAGPYHVTVTTPSGTSADVAADRFTAVAPPTPPLPSVTSLSPTSGPTAGGTTVTIRGTNFNGATQVLFGTVPATGVSVSSSTKLTAVAPAQGAGSDNVFVSTPGGTSAAVTADQFTYVLTLPVVSSLSQSSGPKAGGPSINVRGSGFSGATQVLFGTVPATSFTVVSDTKITAIAPAGTGTVDVVVTTPNGTSTTSDDDQFSYSNRSH
jgi:IPT/TIG domain